MKRLPLLVLVLVAIGFGAQALYGSGGEPGPPCDPDPNVQCLHVADPVTCIKPGEGWKTYGNPCYAMKDCALVHTCRSLED